MTWMPIARCLVATFALAAAPAPQRGQYKQQNRDQITRIVKGQVAEAMAHYRKYLARYPDDPESLYGLAVAHARLKEVDQAMACVRKAVEAGMPAGRFLAGPRDLLKPLTESPAFQEFMRAHPVALIHGPMVGSVTDHSARIWVRTAAEAPVRVRAGRSKDTADWIDSPVARTAGDRDFTAVVELTGLEPDTQYHYRVLVNGAEVAVQPPPTFRTFPRVGSAGRYQVGFGGGAGYTPWHEGMWNTLASRRLRAFLTLGDNVYIDTPEVPQTQRYCYYRRQSRPEYRRFVASTPIFAIWDDHDFGTNDCACGPDIDTPAWKVPVWNVFKENWVNPAYGGGAAAPGVWFRFSLGDVDFFLPDCRIYRTRPKADAPSMIGPVQKRWLLEALGASKATFKVLASSVPWSKGTKPGSRDTWDGFPAEREEIFSFIDKARVGGVFLISADRHRSDAWKTDRPNGYALYEASSSKLTNVHTHRIIKGSLFGYNAKCSFGLLTFDTAKADPELTYQVVNIDNEVIHTLTLKRSQLDPH